MGLLDRDADKKAIIEEIRNLTREVAKLRGERDEHKEALDLTDEILTLKRRVEDLKIEKSRQTEEREREKRETEHLVGLQKKRAEQERELAVKQAQLEVREANLGAKEEMFEERLDAITAQLKEQVEYLRSDIVKSLMERLPIFKVDTMFRPNGDNGHDTKALASGDEDDD